MNFNIPFMRFRIMASILSLSLLVISVASLGLRGLNFGLDFSGGTLIEVSYEEASQVSKVVRPPVATYTYQPSWLSPQSRNVPSHCVSSGAAPPAVMNAVVDALGTDVSMPATAEKVWKTLNKNGSKKSAA